MGVWRQAARAEPRALTALALAMTLGIGAATPAGAAAPHGAAVKRQLTQVQRTLRRLPAGLFANHGRTRTLRLAATAVRRGHGGPCTALVAVDALGSGLRMPTTWKGRRVPAARLRGVTKRLRTVERALFRTAGKRCAKPAKAKPVKPHTGGSGGVKTPSPPDPSDQGEGQGEKIPPGPFRPVKTIGGSSALGADPFGGETRRSASPFAFAASDPLTFFRNADAGIPPRQICCPEEVNAAIAGNVGWYTGNGSVGLSTNGGRTWTMFDPSDVLPDQGLGFCCDQLVSYSPSNDMLVWISQYWCNEACVTSDNHCRTNGAYNRIRIAVARPQDLIDHASNPGLAWTYWDITPQLIGQPINAWFDRSDLSVNPWNANWNVDIICGNAGSLLGRIPLSQLHARGTVTLSYITPGGRYTSAQGLGTTNTYFAGNTSLSQSRIWSWAPFSGTLFPHDINHTSVPIYDSAMIGSDSGNMYDRYGIFPGEVESSTVSGNTIYLAQGTGRAYCTSGCGANQTPVLQHVLDQPAVLVTKFNLSSWNEVGERWLWNPTIAFGYPALQTDGSGDVGIALRSNTPNHNARPVAGFLTPAEQFTFALPEGLPHEIGDYYSLRPGRTSQTFAMTAQTMQNDGGTPRMHWNYIEYGHGTPPYVAPPTVHVTAPANLSDHQQGDTVAYTADVSDPVDGTLPNAAIRWTWDGSPIGTGPSISHTESVIGTHTIIVTATNGDGRSASDTVTIHVNPPPGPVSVAITSPPNNHDFGYSSYNSTRNEDCQDIQFQATVSGGTAPYTYSWDDIRTQDNNPPQPSQQVSTAAPPVTLTLCGGSSVNQIASHDITLTVHDSASHVAQASVRVYVRSEYLG